MYQLGQQTANNAMAYAAGQGSIATTGFVQTTPPPPLTLASALSRSEGLNERIGQAVARLAQIAGVLGALHPTQGDTKANPIASDVVHRLNDAADNGHNRMLEIEDLLSGIERALG